ncbi:MAG TPA: TPM domain-containing protein, partial [Gemmatimonadales bacterium]|nr:TPM domain-containing protein [Gemmatimonadales bacterium]
MALQLAAAVVVAAGAHAQDAIDRLIPPAPTGYLTDAAGIIDATTAAEIERRAERLRSATGAELAVVTLPTLGERSEAEVALAIGRKWGVGRRAGIGDSTRNAGVVLLLVPRQGNQPGTGAIRIEVGQGLEGIVTDAATGAIRNQMLPAAREGNYSESLLTGTRALVAEIADGFGVSDSALTAARPRPAPTGSGGSFPSWLPIVLFLAFILLSQAGRGRRGRRRVYWGGP